MSYKGSIKTSQVYAAGSAPLGVTFGGLGLVESQYYSWGDFAAGLYAFGLYSLLGIGLGVVGAFLFGGSARRDKVRLEKFAGRIAFLFTVLWMGALSGFLVYRDVWMESIGQAGFWGWVFMVLAAGVTLIAGWMARRYARSLVVRAQKIVLVVLCLAVATLVGGVALGSRPPAKSVEFKPESKNTSLPPIVFIVADALRADVVGAYGSGRNDTPNLDAFAKDAVLFKNAWACASWTRPSVASIFSGLYPSSHQTIHKSDRLPENLPVLAALLRQNGYVTLASVTNVNLAPTFGFGRGFDSYGYFAPAPFLLAPSSAARLFGVELYRLLRLRFFPGNYEVSNYYANGERILSHGRELIIPLAVKEIPFFAYFHFMEPHDPYFAHPYNGQAVTRVENVTPSIDKAPEYFELYRQEVRHWDRLLGQLIGFLKEAKLYDRALIVVMADHGEEFADHGGFWHGTSLYQEVVHVPLLVRFPGGARSGTVSENAVSLVDLMPTALQVAGIQGDFGFPGFSLSHELPFTERTLWAEEDHQGCVLSAIKKGRFKLIRANAGNPRGLPQVQLFDLSTDPKEMNDLSTRETAIRNELLKLLEAGPTESSKPPAQSNQVELDPTMQEQLRSLGYTE